MATTLGTLNGIVYKNQRNLSPEQISSINKITNEYKNRISEFKSSYDYGLSNSWKYDHPSNDVDINLEILYEQIEVINQIKKAENNIEKVNKIIDKFTDKYSQKYQRYEIEHQQKGH